MKRVIIAISIFFLCSQFIPVRFRHIYLPDPIPDVLSDVSSIDTLLSGYWVINLGDRKIYPTIVAHIGPDSLEHPSIYSVMDMTKQYFRPRERYLEAKRDPVYGAYFEHGNVRVFVKEREL